MLFWLLLIAFTVLLTILVPAVVFPNRRPQTAWWFCLQLLKGCGFPRVLLFRQIDVDIQGFKSMGSQNLDLHPTAKQKDKYKGESDSPRVQLASHQKRKSSLRSMSQNLTICVCLVREPHKLMGCFSFSCVFSSKPTERAPSKHDEPLLCFLVYPRPVYRAKRVQVGVVWSNAAWPKGLELRSIDLPCLASAAGPPCDHNSNGSGCGSKPRKPLVNINIGGTWVFIRPKMEA